MKILIGADKGGFSLKNAILAHLRELNVEYEDVGTLTLENCKDFTSIAVNVGEQISAGAAERAILICGTGMGMSIAANKFKGVRAAVVESQYAAAYARKINDANVLCMGGFIIGPGMGCEIVDTFLRTGFVEDFPQWRVDFLTDQQERLKTLEQTRFR